MARSDAIGLALLCLSMALFADVGWAAQGVVRDHDEIREIHEGARTGFHGPSEVEVVSSLKGCTACHEDRAYPGDDFFWAEKGLKWRVHRVLATAGLFVLVIGLWANGSMWGLGRAQSIELPVKRRAMGRALVREVLLGERVRKQSPGRWAIFMSVSMGFIFLFGLFVFSFVTRRLLAVDFFLEGPGSHALDLALDLVGLCVLVGSAAALVRRLVTSDETVEKDLGALAPAALLLVLCASGFLLEALRCASLPASGRLWYSFVGNTLAWPLRQWDPSWLGAHFRLWIVHGAIGIAFTAWIPVSRLRHFIACPASILSTASDEAGRERR